MSTINNMWLNSCNLFADKPVICTRLSQSLTSRDGKIEEHVSYRPNSYEQLEELVVSFGSALVLLGVKEREGVGLISENSLRWMAADLAILGNRAYDVPRGTESTDVELLYILDHAALKTVIVENKEQCDRLVRMKDELPLLEKIIVLEEGFKGTDHYRGIYSFDELLNMAEEKERELFKKRRVETLSEDVATLMYTSGTSGVPKGIPLTHANIMHNVRHLPGLVPIIAEDRFLSILPVWHIFERTIEYLVLSRGASLWYTTKFSILKDLVLVNPSYMPSVPRIWISVYNGVMSNVRHAGKMELFEKFFNHSIKVVNERRYQQGRQYLKVEEEALPFRAAFTDHLFHFLGDMLIYKKVRKKLGNFFKAGVSGGGSLPTYIDDFFEVLGITLLEGYGLTETSPVLCVRTPSHRIPYTVGRPMPETRIRILDDDGREISDSTTGVIWVNGPQVMSGYYKNEEESAKVLMSDERSLQWFNTGDLGRWTKQGDITVLGRIKDTIVLIGGENIEPAPIEMAMQKSELIDQVMICGQDQEYLSALVVPAGDKLRELCKEFDIEYTAGEYMNYSNNRELVGVYLSVIESLVSEKTGFRELEKVHAIAFIPPFTMENGLLTHTFKIKRYLAMKEYRNVIKSMYPHYNESGEAKG